MTERALDLGMVRIADHHDLISIGFELFRLHVNLRHHRTGRVDDLEILLFRLIEDLNGQPVRAHEQRAGIDLVDRLRVLQATRCQRFNHLRVMHHVTEGGYIATRGDRLLGLLHRDRHPEAEALDRRLTNFHSYSPPALQSPS